MFACSKHLVKTIRMVAEAPNHTVTVMPAGTGWRCEFEGCDKGAMWGVNPL